MNSAGFYKGPIILAEHVRQLGAGGGSDAGEIMTLTQRMHSTKIYTTQFRDC